MAFPGGQRNARRRREPAGEHGDWDPTGVRRRAGHNIVARASPGPSWAERGPHPCGRSSVSSTGVPWPDSRTPCRGTAASSLLDARPRRGGRRPPGAERLLRLRRPGRHRRGVTRRRHDAEPVPAPVRLPRGSASSSTRPGGSTSAAGWMHQPDNYHRRPPRPRRDDITSRRGRALGTRYQRLRSRAASRRVPASPAGERW